MKRATSSTAKATVREDAAREYRFDYRKAKPNRFAERAKSGSLTVTLDPDVAEVFTTAESVNTILRALIAAMPKSTK